MLVARVTAIAAALPAFVCLVPVTGSAAAVLSRRDVTREKLDPKTVQ
jgi:hypothetical protein